MRARFLEAAGLRTRILHEGTGEAVLLLHGLGTTAERWIRNIDPLAKHFAVFAPDLPGAGFTDDVDYRDTPQAAHLGHLAGLLDALGVQRFSVVGSSYGGLLAALLALAMPDRVNRVVIVGSGSALHPPEEQKGVLQAAEKNAISALEDGSYEATRKRMERIVFDPASVPEAALSIQLTANAWPGRKASARQLYPAMVRALDVGEAQVFSRLEQIAQPTLIVTGRDDIRASWQCAADASKRIRDCRLEIFDACGHGPMLEHPERFNRVVIDFLLAK